MDEVTFQQKMQELMKNLQGQGMNMFSTSGLHSNLISI